MREDEPGASAVALALVAILYALSWLVAGSPYHRLAPEPVPAGKEPSGRRIGDAAMSALRAGVGRTR